MVKTCLMLAVKDWSACGEIEVNERGKAKPKDVISQIKKATRRKFSADEKIRIVLEGLRGENALSELCRREGIAASVYYKWSKAFLEAGKNGLTKDTLRDATSDEVKKLRQENEQLKQSMAEAILLLSAQQIASPYIRAKTLVVFINVI